MTAAPPVVTVLRDKLVPSPEKSEEQERDAVQAVDLSIALLHRWPTDAHMTAYAPHRLPVVGTDERWPVRLTRSAIAEGVHPAMVALIADIDPPGHEATPAWRNAVRAALHPLPVCWYETRNGARAIQILDTPFVIASEADEETWRRVYRGWLQWLTERGVPGADTSVHDWTRLFRLPRVRRDGRDEYVPVYPGLGFPPIP